MIFEAAQQTDRRVLIAECSTGGDACNFEFKVIWIWQTGFAQHARGAAANHAAGGEEKINQFTHAAMLTSNVAAP